MRESLETLDKKFVLFSSNEGGIEFFPSAYNSMIDVSDITLKSFTDVFRISPIESKCVFIQIALKMIFFKTSMIGSKKHSLDQRGHHMHSRQNAFLVFGFYLENLFMHVAFFLKRTVSLPTISHNSTPGNDIGFDERYKLISRAIINYLKSDAH